MTATIPTIPAPFSFTDAHALDDLATNARRFQWNVQALRVLRDLETEGRAPTPEEQLILAHYTAFGNSEIERRAIQVVTRTGKYEPKDEFVGLISNEDAAAIARGALTQFFTPLWLSLALGSIAERALANVAQPRILEPAAGIGMLVASLPAACGRCASLSTC